MDERTLFFIIVAAMGLWTSLLAVRLGVAWLQLMRMRFGQAEVSTVDRAGMPADVSVILDSVGERLAELGFSYEETVLAQPMLRGNGSVPRWIDIHVHAASGSRALTQVAESPEPGLSAAVSFTTDFEQSMIETENRRLHLLFPMPAYCQLEDAAAASLAEHWAFHCRRLAASTAGAVVTDAEMRRQRHRALRAGLLEHCRQCGLMRSEGEQYRLTARGAWRFLRQVMAGNRQVALLPPNAEIENVSLRVLADAHAWQAQETLLKNNVMSRRGKLLCFALSALAGAVAFGVMVSWTMVPIIMGVLLFHELGHALAMRLVGYRGLSVLVLPFLGAIAIGRKDDASPRQKLIVLLAGPLPGLILAVVCLRLSLNDPDQESLLLTIGALALTINLFNLLPFAPLDGGQIVDTFLFSRRPRFGFVFFALSAGGLLVVAGVLNSIPLAAAALLIALAIPATWKRMHLLAGIDPAAMGKDPVHALLQRVHATPGPRWPAFAQRMQTVRILLPWMNARAPTRVESLLGIGTYLFVIALPVALLWDTGFPQQALQSLSRPDANAAPPDWAKQLAQAKTPEARWTVLWDAGRWFEDAEDQTQALQHYQQALAETALLPDDSKKILHALDARIAVARLTDHGLAERLYVELLPALRELPPDERWRLADVLDTMNWLDQDATAEARIERYREAVAAREGASTSNIFRLLDDRVQLARLIDAAGDASGAEALLRKNLTYLSSEQQETTVWQLDPVIWFLIAHDRAAEAEAILVAKPMPPRNSEMLRATLAWTHLAQGRADTARKILAETAGQIEKQRWNNTQRLMLLLDLIHASAAAPDEEAHWLKTATDLKNGLGPEYQRGRFLMNAQRDRTHWEHVRNLARFEAYKRLPGVEDELSEDNGKICK